MDPVNLQCIESQGPTIFEMLEFLLGDHGLVTAFITGAIAFAGRAFVLWHTARHEVQKELLRLAHQAAELDHKGNDEPGLPVSSYVYFHYNWFVTLAFRRTVLGKLVTCCNRVRGRSWPRHDYVRLATETKEIVAAYQGLLPMNEHPAKIRNSVDNAAVDGSGAEGGGANA